SMGYPQPRLVHTVMELKGQPVSIIKNLVRAAIPGQGHQHAWSTLKTLLVVTKMQREQRSETSHRHLNCLHSELLRIFLEFPQLYIPFQGHLSGALKRSQSSVTKWKTST